MSVTRLIRLGGKLLYEGVLALVVLFMVVPTVIVVLLSFSGDKFIRFPPQSWGPRQYETLFGSDEWLTPLWRSLGLGLSSALLAGLAGCAAGDSRGTPSGARLRGWCRLRRRGRATTGNRPTRVA